VTEHPSPAPPDAQPPIIGVRHEGIIVAKKRLSSAQDRTSDAITAFAGSMRFVYLHAVWFGAWIALNVGLVGGALVFDKYPFGLLTMIVSLEAIFLSTFVMISQNREAARADIRSELDFETNVRSEAWTKAIAEQLGVDSKVVEAQVRAAVTSAKAELKTAKGLS
jgi:uncharacterized membrane protein